MEVEKVEGVRQWDNKQLTYMLDILARLPNLVWLSCVGIGVVDDSGNVCSRLKINLLQWSRVA